MLIRSLEEVMWCTSHLSANLHILQTVWGQERRQCLCLISGAAQNRTQAPDSESWVLSALQWTHSNNNYHLSVCSLPGTKHLPIPIPYLQSSQQPCEGGMLLLLLLLLLLSRFSRVRLCATPWTAAHQAPLSLGFSRQEHWSGLPFPSPMHACMLSRFSCVRLCATPWTAAHQAPLSRECSRQEYWRRVLEKPFPSPLRAVYLSPMYLDLGKLKKTLPKAHSKQILKLKFKERPVWFQQCKTWVPTSYRHTVAFALTT